MHKDSCTPPLTAARFTAARTEKQQKCPSRAAGIQKLRYKHTKEQYSSQERNGIMGTHGWTSRTGVKKMQYDNLEVKIQIYQDKSSFTKQKRLTQKKKKYGAPKEKVQEQGIHQVTEIKRYPVTDLKYILKENLVHSTGKQTPNPNKSVEKKPKRSRSLNIRI